MISKGKVYIPANELKKLFNLPEDVEITRVDMNSHDGSFEFVIMSSDPVDELTFETDNFYSYRRNRVPYRPTNLLNALESEKEYKNSNEEESKFCKCLLDYGKIILTSNDNPVCAFCNKPDMDVIC